MAEKGGVSKKVSLNKSTFEELKTLKGVGVQYAQQILNVRKLSARPIVVGDFQDNPGLHTILQRLETEGTLIVDLDRAASDHSDDPDPRGDAEDIPAWYQSAMELMLKRMDARDAITHERISQMELSQHDRLAQFESKMERRFQEVHQLPKAEIAETVSSVSHGLGARPKTPKLSPPMMSPPMTLSQPSTSPTPDDVRRQSQLIEEVGAKYLPPHIRDKKLPVSTGHMMSEERVSSGNPTVHQPGLSGRAAGMENIAPGGYQSYPSNPGQHQQGPYGGGGRVYHPKITPYNGKTDFYPFCKKLELMSVAYGWTEGMKHLKLIENLTDEALALYCRQSPEVSCSYELMKGALARAFGKEEDPYLHRSELGAILQRVDETLEDFGRRVREVSSKAYPDAPTDMLETLAIDAFLKGCTDSEAVKLAMVSQPKTLSEAVKYTRQNSYFDLMAKKHRSRARRITFEDTSDVSSVRQVQASSNISSLEETLKSIDAGIRKIFDKLENRGNGDGVRYRSPSPDRTEGNRSPSPRYSPRRSAPSHNRCFNCDEEGHFSKECPKPQRPRLSPKSMTPLENKAPTLNSK